MEIWDLPHRVKVLEALGCIAQGRIELTGDNKAKTSSSVPGRFYYSYFDPDHNAIFTNDTMSFYVERLGYPSIAFLALKGIIKYDKSISNALSKIKFNEFNKKYKNKWDDIEIALLEYLESKGIPKEKSTLEMNDIMNQLRSLKLRKPEKMFPPPARK